jgi:hypothetical protein
MIETKQQSSKLKSPSLPEMRTASQVSSKHKVMLSVIFNYTVLHKVKQLPNISVYKQ